MTTPDEPKLPPRKPVELPPINRSPVDDTSNAAYSALTPRPHPGDAPAHSESETAVATTDDVSAGRDLADAEADAHVRAAATDSARSASARSASAAPAAAGLGLSRAGLISSLLLSAVALVLAVALSVTVEPSPLWPLYLGASLGAVSVLLAALARRHRGWGVALGLAIVVVVGCIGFAFALG